MRFDRWKTFWVIAIVGFFGGSIALVFTGDEGGSSAVAAEQDGKGEEPVPAVHDVPAAPAAPAIRKTAEGCLADAATLEDLRRQKFELETRKTELNTREAELKTREQALSDQLKSLAVAREEIEKIDSSRRAEGDAKVAKLVETVESMNPKSASAMVAGLDETLATATMARLSTAKLAKILNVMDPARSTRLSELLAGVARAKTRPVSHDTAVATTERVPASQLGGSATGPSKGGERNDGKSHEQSDSSKSTTDGSARAPRR